MITVIIPSFKRPELLRVCLDSVRRQTFLHLVSKIVVSENGLNPLSREVCEEFSDLPIDYHYQTTQLTISEHLKWVLQVNHGAEYTAMLCDDDWWDIHHLELAVRALELNTQAVCYFSNFVFLEQHESLKQSLYGGLQFMHLFRDNTETDKPFLLTKQSMYPLSYLLTPFHYSAMVSRSEFLINSLFIFDDVHPTATDRLLWVAIASQGAIVFNPLPTALVRVHSEMASHDYDSVTWRNERRNSAQVVVALAAKDGIDVRNSINEAYAQAESNDKHMLNKELSIIHLDRSELAWYKGHDAICNADALENAWSRRAKRTIKTMLRRVVS